MAGERKGCSDKGLRRLMKCKLDPESAHFGKGGWLHRRGRFKRGWVGRWYEISSFDQSFLYSHGGPSQAGKPVLCGSVLRAAKIEGSSLRGQLKMHGLKVWDVRGNCRELYCESLDVRDSWVYFLNRLTHAKVQVTDRYRVQWHNTLGSGAYASVVKGHDLESGHPVAIKVVSSGARQLHSDLVRKEVEVMRRIQGQSQLLALREVFVTEDSTCIVTDCLAGGDLHSFHKLGKGPVCTESEACQIVRQLLLALAHLHAHGIAHCDVKPENVLLASRDLLSSVTLADYNSAVFQEEEAAPGGTPEYMAPELLHSDVLRQGMSSRLDMWALGVLTFWLLCGRTPFAAESIPGVLLNILSGRFEWPPDVQLSVEAKSLISSLMRSEPDDRPQAEQLLSHPWVRGEASAKDAATALHSPAGALCPPRQMRAECLPGTRADVELLNCTASVTAGCSERLVDQQHAQSPASGLLALPRKLSIKVSTRPRTHPSDSDGLRDCSDSHFLDADCTFLPDGGAKLELVPYEGSASEDEARDPLDSCMSIHGTCSSVGKAAHHFWADRSRLTAVHAR